MHGIRPSPAEVWASQPDVQYYYQFIEDLYLDGMGILRIRQANPEGLPVGKIVIPLHPELRENILERGHNHESRSCQEDQAAFWKSTQHYF